MPYYLIIAAVVVVLILYVVSTQRKFIGIGERRENALSSIGVQQNSRWDALTQLAKVVKGYATHESETLEKVIAMRGSNAPKTVGDIANDDQLFGRAMTSINAVVEQYPDLKASPLYGELMGSINGYESNVRTARMVYNDVTTRWNQLVRRIPSSFVAAIFGFQKEAYLDIPKEKQDMPDLDI